MAAQSVVMEGEFLQESEQNDPDLNKAFYDFIDTVNQEANSGGTIKVFRVPTDAAGNPRPKTQGKSTLFSVPVGACTFDDICDRVVKDFMNPGEKTTIQLMATQDGKSGIRFNRMITLEKGRGEYVNGGASGEIAQLMRLMNEQRAQDRSEMRELLSQRSVPAVDPLSQSLAITKQLTEMAVAMSGRSVPGSPGVAAPVGSPTDPNNMMNQMMAMMMTRMMKKFFDGDDGERKQDASAGILDNIRALAAPLLQAKAASEERALTAEKRMLAHERLSPPTPPAPEVPARGQSYSVETPQPQNEPPSAPKTTEDAKMKLMAMLKEALPLIVEIAKSKSAPEDAARLALKEIPEDDHDLADALYALVQEDDCLKQMAVLEPRVMEHSEWFEKFRGALRDEFDPDGLDTAAAKS